MENEGLKLKFLPNLVTFFLKKLSVIDAFDRVLTHSISALNAI